MEETAPSTSTPVGLKLAPSAAVVARWLRQAVGLHQAGQLDQARQTYERVLRSRPDHFDACQLLGALLHQQGHHADALPWFDKALNREALPSAGAAAAYNNRGSALAALERHQEAMDDYSRAIALKSGFADAYHNRALAHKHLGQWDLAESDETRALAHDPDNVAVLVSLGRLRWSLHKLPQALQCYDRLVLIQPRNADYWCARGNLLSAMHHEADAKPAFEEALKHDPANVVAWIGLGNNLKAMQQLDAADACYAKAIAANPQSANAYYNRAILRALQNRADDALADYDQAIALKPQHASAHCNRASVLLKMGRTEEAIKGFTTACQLQPDKAIFHNNLANALRAARQYAQAHASFSRALELDPDLPGSRGLAAQCQQQVANWTNYCSMTAEIASRIRAGQAVSSPFCSLSISDDPALLKQCAERFACDFLGNPQKLAAKRHNGKIRIAYLSCDFKSHVVMLMLKKVFELHDRTRFETYAYDYGTYTGNDPVRPHLLTLFDHVVDVQALTDQQIAEHLRAQEIAIAVDLMGYTQGGRPGILTTRAAAVQVSYIGFPGTMGAPWIDYIIADPVLIPPDLEQCYSEQVVRLPECYIPVDHQRKIKGGITRASEGLPENAFVFCAFSNTYKITPAVFAVWMRLLHAVAQSVLWLVKDNDDAARNLALHAQAHGIDPKRLIFAERTGYNAYLSRYVLADLFLDTSPYNALATASDALKMNLPVVTCTGSTYVGRGATSLVTAAGLPELATASLQEYEALALKLAMQPDALSAIRHKLAANLENSPMLATPRYVRYLEAAYAHMFDLAARGAAPTAFNVKDLAAPADAQGVPAASATAAPRQQADALLHQAFSFHQAGRLDAAEEIYRRALDVTPLHFGATRMLATVLHQKGQHVAALEWFDKAVTLQPDDALAWNNRGSTLKSLGRLQDALVSYARAIHLKPDYADPHDNRTVVLRMLHRLPEALPDYDRALEMAPDNLDMLGKKLRVLMELKRYGEAEAVCRHLLRLQPDAFYVAGARLVCLSQVQQWEAHAGQLQSVLAALHQGKAVTRPFTLLHAVDDPSIQRRCSEIAYKQSLPVRHAQQAPCTPRRTASGQRLRIAYLSADFSDHAVMSVLAEVFELHNRALFEVHAYNYGTRSDSRMSQRLRRGFENFHDVANLTDQQIADHMARQGIDIAVDLMGYTLGARTSIFSLRPAPVIVNYIGYPGTMGTPWHDYIIGDPILIPPGHEAHYSEQVVRLPHCYLPHDRRHRPAPIPARASCHLPQNAFVFCAFSKSYKITAPVFSVWMHLLRQVPHGVLWLVDGSDAMKQQFSNAALAHGVDPHRLVYASSTGYASYLARYAIADLFLDTMPYNALATATDALWMGLPVLTCTGQTYVARGATSIVTAAGLPELATANLQEYEAMALKLAMQPLALKAIKDKLVAHRDSCALFDTPRYVRHLEAAYAQMWTLAQQGRPPESFALPPVAHAHGPVEVTLPAPENQAAPNPAPPSPTVTVHVKRMTPNPRVKAAHHLLQRAVALHTSDRLEEAAPLYQQILDGDPDHFDANNMMAALLLQQGKHAQALQWVDRAIAIDPRHCSSYNNRGLALVAMNRAEEALASYAQAIWLQPDFVDAYNNRAIALRKLHRIGLALQDYEKAFALQPDMPYLAGSILLCLSYLKRWDDHARQLQYLVKSLHAGHPVALPFILLHASDDPALQRLCSEITSKQQLANKPQAPVRPAVAPGNRLRIAYLSADFANHAVMRVLAEVFELHDRHAIEVHAYNYGKPSGTLMAGRLRQAFEHFHEVRRWSDQQIADHMRSQGIHIAVDLMGYTQGTRIGILALRPAPVVVNYIGFPGTMGNSYHDYIIGDQILIPAGHAQYYSEQVVRLPDCYLPYDGRNKVARNPVRALCGLPEHAFVFCAFSNSYKITEPVFALWMRLLRAVPASVLWLIDGCDEMKAQFSQMAVAQGVDPGRLIYAGRVGYASYLDRYALADLFLDTMPYNALATATDALCMRLPVLTCTGQTYVARGATSIVTAAGLPELATANLQEYEAMALKLAMQPLALKAIKDKLVAHRDSCALFDTPRYVRHLEAAYAQMFQIASKGLPAQGFDVAALPGKPSSG